MLEKLIGSQILKIAEDYIEVQKDGKIYKLEINEDQGDCCGWADFKTNLLYTENDIRNPIITNVETEDTSDGDSSSSIITFFGEYKPLVSIESNSGSGSGWCYGACVSLECKALDITEILVSY